MEALKKLVSFPVYSNDGFLCYSMIRDSFSSSYIILEFFSEDFLLRNLLTQLKGTIPDVTGNLLYPMMSLTVHQKILEFLRSMLYLCLIIGLLDKV